MKLTVAQAIVKFIDNQYIELDSKQVKFLKGVYTIFGHGNVLGLGQALENDNHNLEVYQGKSEQGMALSAMAYAKQKNRMQIMAVTSSIGPGAMNMVTAAGCATINNIPLLLLPGDNFANRVPDPVLQQIEQSQDLTITNNDAFKAVSKFFDRIDRPEKLYNSLINAFRVLTDQSDTGAVVVALNQDVQAESFDFDESFFEKRVWKIKRTLTDENEINTVCDLLNNAKKPLIIAGGGVKYSQAQDDLLKISTKFNIPIAFSQAGKGCIVSDFKNNLGGIGVTGNLMANRYLQECDLIIALGTRLNDFTTQSNTGFNKVSKIVNVNISRYDGLKSNSIHINADVKDFLMKISEKEFYFDIDLEVEELKTLWKLEEKLLEKGEIFVKDTSISPTEFKEFHSSSLFQTQVINYFNNHIEPSSVIVGSSGSLPGDLQRIWNDKSINSYHMEYGYSCMGYEINGSVGVKQAEPDKEVYSFVGDGSFNMSHSEILSSVQLGQKINIILFDNNGYGCINNLQMSKEINSFRTELRYITNNKEQGFIKVDYAKVASGYGLKTYSIYTIEELRDALVDSKKCSCSTLFDIKVLPKSMTEGYQSFWDCGVSSIGFDKLQQLAYEKHNEERER